MAVSCAPEPIPAGSSLNPSSTVSSSLSASERATILNESEAAEDVKDRVLSDARSTAAKSPASVFAPGRTVTFTFTATAPVGAGDMVTRTVAVSPSSVATYDEAPKETVRTGRTRTGPMAALTAGLRSVGPELSPSI